MNARNFRPIENAPAARRVGIIHAPIQAAKTMILLAPGAVAEQFSPRDPRPCEASDRRSAQQQPGWRLARIYFPQ
jgi:hypothetical protein